MSEETGNPVNKFKGKTAIDKNGQRRPLNEILAEEGTLDQKLKADYEREMGEPAPENIQDTFAPTIDKPEEVIIDPSLEGLDVDQLKEYAKSKGIKIHHNAKDKSKILKKIKEFEQKPNLL